MNIFPAHDIPRQSLFHRWDPRCKLAGLFIILFTYSFINNILMLLPMFFVTLIFVSLSCRPLSFFVRKLRFPSLFILAVVLALPFVSGAEVIADFGVIQMTWEGTERAVLVAARFICIMTTAMTLLFSSSFLVNIKALQALGMPFLMADMALLVYRYLEVIGNDFHRMRISMKLRGFEGRRLTLRTLKTVAWSSGSLILRSYERSDWIYRAMRLRGYGSNQITVQDFKAEASDILLLLSVAVIAIIFISAEVLFL